VPLNARRTASLACLIAMAAWAAATAPASASELATGHAGPMSGLVHAKGLTHSGKPGGGGTPNLIYHGGPVITSGTVVRAIFWGTRWSDPAFVSDKISGMASFYSNVGKMAYMATNSEYTDSSGAHVSTAVGYQGSVVDNNPAPSHAPKTSDILAEVDKMIPNPVANGYYPVYVDTPRGHTGYCAWHSYGTTSSGVVVQFAFFFNLDGDRGCDPQDASGAHTEGTAALGNVSGHELSEMATDRHLSAWYDASGAENSDKCAWTFGAQPLKLGNTTWKIQGNWSNAAYDSDAGYTFSGSTVRGCIDGTNR
jgi:hypothetical protein